MKQRRSKMIILISLCVVAGFAIVTVFALKTVHLKSTSLVIRQEDYLDVQNASVSTEKRVTAAAMGDMLAHQTIINNAKVNDGYDFTKYFSLVRPSYTSADLVFCNQEGLSSGEGFLISGYPSFNAPEQFSKDLTTGTGCNIIGLANNHMGDKGVEATNATIANWESIKPLAFSGANRTTEEQEGSVKYVTVNDIKIAYVAFADFNNNRATPAYSVNIYHDEALVRRLVSKARTEADVVIVSMHWGVEDSSIVSENQKEQVKRLADLGVDVVIGTGPHVLQPVEVVTRQDGKKMVVWYSLGNFLSSQLELNQLVGGVALFDIVKSEKSIVLENLKFVPTYMHYEWTLAEKTSNNLLARKNVNMFLLKDAAGPLSRSLFRTSVDEQFTYVKETLGTAVKVVTD